MTAFRFIAGRSRARRIAVAVAALAAGCAVASWAQDGAGADAAGADAGAGAGFAEGGAPAELTLGASLGLGIEHTDDDGATWQAATLAPELTAGPFSLGLALKLRFRFDGGPDGNRWEIRDADWRPDPSVPGRSFLDLFLPVIRYARYGVEGEPFVVRLGSYDHATLGSGFVLGGYANTALLPARRLFGADLDIDGAAFNFPVLGLEAVVGHAPAADLVGARLWARPLWSLGVPLVSSIQVGATAAADFSPFRYRPEAAGDVRPGRQANVSALGADLVAPVVADPSFSAAIHGDVALLGSSEVDTGRSVGMAFGVRGSAVGAVRYGVQLRLTDDRFMPVYFDADYDRLRADKYRALRGLELAAERAASTPTTPTQGAMTPSADALQGLVHLGWAARVGLSLLEQRVDVDLSLAGPITGQRGALAGVPYAHVSGLQVQGRLGVRDVGIPGASVAIDYRKRSLGGLGDLIDPQHLSLGASLRYRTGGTVLAFSYRGRYDPATAGLVGAPSVESWIELF